MKRTFALLLIAITPFAFADESTVFVGIPTSLAVASEENAERVTLEGKDAADKQVVIVKRDDKYYWRSRQDTELFYFAAGAMHFFIAPTSGYIKIMDTSSIAALLDEKPPRYMYFENMSQLLTTLTYHGIGTELAL